MNEKKTQIPLLNGYMASEHRDFASVKEVVDFLAEPRLWAGSKQESEGSTRTELFSSKQKGNAVEYRYFSPMESQRGTWNKHDPELHEQNARWEKEFLADDPGARESRWKFWAWDMREWMGWQMVRWSVYQEAKKYVETNEWGEVSP